MHRISENSKKNIVGYNVKRIRMEKNMTQQELADKLELISVYICRSSIAKIEDQTRMVTDIELKGISEILKEPIEHFFSP